MLYIASDHAGFELKEILKKYLFKLGESYKDLGPKKFISDDDYPDYAALLARRVSKEKGRGILICGSGIGMSIVANKFRGVRAAIGYSFLAAEMSRSHDDVNVLCLSARVLTCDQAKKIVRKWLSTQFLREPRHERRIAKIADIERANMKQ